MWKRVCILPPVMAKSTFQKCWGNYSACAAHNYIYSYIISMQLLLHSNSLTFKCKSLLSRLTDAIFNRACICTNTILWLHIYSQQVVIGSSCSVPQHLDHLIGNVVWKSLPIHCPGYSGGRRSSRWAIEGECGTEYPTILQRDNGHWNWN